MILNRFSADDRKFVVPYLEQFDLPARTQLSRANVAVEHVYFLETGIASTTASIRKQAPIEVGLTGREGVANLFALMGVDRTSNDVFMQVGGGGFRLDVERMRAAMERSPAMVRVLMTCAYLFMAQTAATAVANGRANVSERLSRWLLMAQDRLDGDVVPLTHEFLAIMLCVRRAGVTVALGDLERIALVAGRRGEVQILDREGLEAHANGYYGGAEAEMRRALNEG